MCILPVCKLNNPIRLNVPMIDLVVSFMGNFRVFSVRLIQLMKKSFQKLSSIARMLGKLLKNHISVYNSCLLCKFWGGHTVPRIFSMILDCNQSWHQRNPYIQHQSELGDIEICSGSGNPGHTTHGRRKPRRVVIKSG